MTMMFLLFSRLYGSIMSTKSELLIELTESKQELSSYQDGLDAAYRSGRYKNEIDTPECPFLIDTPDSSSWWEGFGHGTEDFIFWKMSG